MNRLPTDVAKIVYRYIYDNVIRNIVFTVEWYAFDDKVVFNKHLSKSEYTKQWSRIYTSTSILLFNENRIMYSNHPKLLRFQRKSVINGNIYSFIINDFTNDIAKRYKLIPLKENVANCWTVLKELADKMY